jgi:hypothetical protein
MAVNQWFVLIWHDATLVNGGACWRLTPRCLCNSPDLGMRSKGLCRGLGLWHG